MTIYKRKNTEDNKGSKEMESATAIFGVGKGKEGLGSETRRVYFNVYIYLFGSRLLAILYCDGCYVQLAKN
jgi:hypothetical protein